MLFSLDSFPILPKTRIILLNLGGALITSLFLYFIMCLFTTFGHWEGKVVENKQPFELGRFIVIVSLLPSPLQPRPTFTAV